MVIEFFSFYFRIFQKFLSQSTCIFPCLNFNLILYLKMVNEFIWWTSQAILCEWIIFKGMYNLYMIAETHMWHIIAKKKNWSWICLISRTNKEGRLKWIIWIMGDSRTWLIVLKILIAYVLHLNSVLEILDS